MPQRFPSQPLSSFHPWQRTLKPGRARHRTVGAEHATIARLRPQAGAAAGAFVIESAGIGRHDLRFGHAAMRTSNDRFADHGFLTGAPTMPVVVMTVRLRMRE